MNMQQRADKRSAALHREIAKKLKTDNDLWDIPKRNLAKWKNRRGAESAAVREWERILNIKSKQEILAILEGDTEEAVRLRSSSPFTGILDQDERKKFSNHSALKGIKTARKNNYKTD